MPRKSHYGQLTIHNRYFVPLAVGKTPGGFFLPLFRVTGYIETIKENIFMKLFLLTLALFFFLATPSFAADDKASKEIAKETPITKWIDAENKLLDTLPRGNQDVFFIFRNKHAVIRSINVVERDIKNAVKACGKENSDLKSPMNNRFKEWQNAVHPILTEAQKFLKQELKEQDAFHVSDYQYIMKLNDKAYEFSESKVEKTPVTTKEACEGLLNSMDMTEDKLVTLLQEVLLPEAVVRERVEQAEKAQKEAEEKAKKSKE